MRRGVVRPTDLFRILARSITAVTCIGVNPTVSPWMSSSVISLPWATLSTMLPMPTLESQCFSCSPSAAAPAVPDAAPPSSASSSTFPFCCWDREEATAWGGECESEPYVGAHAQPKPNTIVRR